MKPMTQDHDVQDVAAHLAIDTVCDELRSAVGSFQDNAEWMADEKDLERLAILLDALTEAKANLTAIERDIAPVVAELMGQQQVTVNGFRLERRGGKDRKSWQSGSIWSELVRRSRFDPDTGEELSTEGARERLIQMTYACVPFTGSLGWRTRALRSFGLDPDEYCESTPAPYRVEITKVTDEGEAA